MPVPLVSVVAPLNVMLKLVTSTHEMPPRQAAYENRSTGSSLRCRAGRMGEQVLGTPSLYTRYSKPVFTARTRARRRTRLGRSWGTRLWREAVSRRHVYRPGRGDTSREQMRAHVRGELPRRARLTAMYRRMAADHNVNLLEHGDGRFTPAHRGTARLSATWDGT